MRKVAQAQAAHDVAAETCETAAQPIEQGSKRVSNSVRGVGSGLKVFISHCKRISGTEDKAIWIADVLDSSEVDVKACFDLSDLSEITMLRVASFTTKPRFSLVFVGKEATRILEEAPDLFQDSRCLFQDSRYLFQDSRCLFWKQGFALKLLLEPSHHKSIGSHH